MIQTGVYQRIDSNTPQSTPDKDLVENAKHGGTECFERLVQRYYENIFRYVVNRVGDRQEAEDITQNTFFNVFKGLESFNSKYSFKTWLFSIAHNCMVSYLRRKKPTEQLYENACARPSHEKQMDDADQLQMVWEAARKLPPDQFTALWLRYNEAMDNRSIAYAMGKSSVNVRVLLHRARNSLADILKTEQ